MPSTRRRPRATLMIAAGVAAAVGAGLASAWSMAAGHGLVAAAPAGSAATTTGAATGVEPAPATAAPGPAGSAAALSARSAPVAPLRVQTSSTQVSPFVRASGTGLVVNGAAYRFTGYDMYQLTTTPSSPARCGGPMTDSDVAGLFDQVRTASGGSVVRTWFFQSLGGPGNWAAFDRTVSLARSHGVRIVATLVNQWGDCEPAVGSPPVSDYKTMAWYQSGYRVAADGYPLSFRRFAAAVAARYAGNPAIAFWQLVNEAEDKTSANGDCPSGAGTALAAFAQDMVTVIHGVDRNHLISLGTMGSGQCGTSGTSTFQAINRAVDLCEVHDYGDPTNAIAYPSDLWNGMAVRLADCAALNKPIFVGEAGICAEVQPGGSCAGTASPASLQLRAAYFAAKMKAEFGAGIAGYLIWSKGTGVSAGYDVGPGDPTEQSMSGQTAALRGA